jgi:hypothetical protein
VAMRRNARRRPATGRILSENTLLCFTSTPSNDTPTRASPRQARDARVRKQERTPERLPTRGRPRTPRDARARRPPASARERAERTLSRTRPRAGKASSTAARRAQQQ